MKKLIDNDDDFIKYLRKKVKISNKVGGYYFPNKDAADWWIKESKQINDRR